MVLFWHCIKRSHAIIINPHIEHVSSQSPEVQHVDGKHAVPSHKAYNQGLIKPPKAARGHATHVDSEIHNVTNNK